MRCIAAALYRPPSESYCNRALLAFSVEPRWGAIGGVGVGGGTTWQPPIGAHNVRGLSGHVLVDGDSLSVDVINKLLLNNIRANGTTGANVRR